MQDPWMLAGDFNDIACAAEKKGWAPISIRKYNKFKERMDMCHLMDLGAIGSKFTWRGPIYHGGQRIFERLDRALSNGKWRLEFPDGYVKFLASLDFSDHHPILKSSRAKWLADGDRNTRYYHLKTVTRSRRRKNDILMLRDDQGQWIEDVEQLHDMVNEFYKKLFSNNHCRMEWLQTNVTYPTLEEDVLVCLSAPIEDNEVRSALFNMNPWKAPGPDGFPAGFYQKSWRLWEARFVILFVGFGTIRVVLQW